MKDKRLFYPAGILRRFTPGMAWGVVLFVLFCLLPGNLWAATTHYVDAANTGVEDGTIDNPWKNISSIPIAVDDTIRFKRGQTWHESLIIPADGVTIEAYGNSADPLPIFDGTTTVNWTDTGDGVRWSSVTTFAADPGLIIYNGEAKPSIATLSFSSDVSGVKANAILIQSGGNVGYCNLLVTSVDVGNGKVSGITFFRAAKHWDVSQGVQLRQLDSSGHEVKSNLTLASDGLTVSQQSLQKNGDWYWNPDDSKLYLFSDTDPTSVASVGALETGISASGRQNLVIQDIAVQGFQGTGVHLDQTAGTTVQRLQVTNIGAKTGTHKTGIMLDQCDASINNNTITGNTIDSVLRVGIGIYATSSANPSRGNIISGNTIKYSGSSGISLNTDDSTTAATVTDNTITGNTILYSNRLAYDSAGVYAIFVGTGNSITNNTILLGGSKYLRSAGIMVDQGVAPPVIITGNRLENNSLGGIVVTGTGHTITGNRLSYNGLASWDSAQIVFFPVIENVSGSTVRNNVVEAETGKYLFLETIVSTWSNPTNDIDSNTYRSRAASTFCRNDWSGSGVCGWVNFATWKSTTGHDTNSSFSFITDPPPQDVKSINSTYLLLLK